MSSQLYVLIYHMWSFTLHNFRGKAGVPHTHTHIHTHTHTVCATRPQQRTYSKKGPLSIHNYALDKLNHVYVVTPAKWHGGDSGAAGYYSGHK